MARQIFRTAALDRLSSPERLDQLIGVTTPRGWLALVSLCALIAVGLAWCIWGRVPTTVRSPGLLVTRAAEAEGDGGPVLGAVALVPLVGGRIQPGMEVRVAPSTVQREQYGFLHGRVATMSATPLTGSELRRLLDNDLLLEQFNLPGAPYVVEVELPQHPRHPSALHWSSSKGPPYELSAGTLCEMEIIIDHQPSISLLIPLARRTLGVD